MCFHELDSAENQLCVDFAVIPPTGIDLDAYEHFKGQPLADHTRFGELLHRFPTSTYAAYIVWDFSLAATLVRSWTRDTIGEVIYKGDLLVPCVHGYDEKSHPFESIFHEAVPAWREEWLGLVLEEKPDIWFADELRYTRACNQFARHKNAEGAAQLTALAKNASPEIAEKASQLIALLEQAHPANGQPLWPSDWKRGNVP